MRILFVAGIKTPQMYLRGWRQDLKKYFPNAEIIFLDEYYLHFQYKKTEKIVQKGVNILNDGKETIIIAHSFGGILSKTIINRSENANIKLLITMASPHQLKFAGLRKAKEFLKTPEAVDVPTISFGGFFDPICVFWKTTMAEEEHENFCCEHLSFLLSPKIRKKVIQKILETVKS